MSKRDDEIYESLSNNEDVLVGWCAYLSYLEEKKEWVEVFKGTNKKPPTETDLTIFYSKAKQSKKKYQEKGNQLLEWALLQEYEKRIEIEKKACYDDIKNQVKEALKEQHVPPTRRGFWVNVLSSLIGSIAFAIISATFVILYYLPDGVNVKEWMQELKQAKEAKSNNQNPLEKSAVDEKTAPYTPVDTTQSRTLSGERPIN